MYFYINDYTNILQLYILKKNNIDLLLIIIIILPEEVLFRMQLLSRLTSVTSLWQLAPIRFLGIIFFHRASPSYKPKIPFLKRRLTWTYREWRIVERRARGSRTREHQQHMREQHEQPTAGHPQIHTCAKLYSENPNQTLLSYKARNIIWNK